VDCAGEIDFWVGDPLEWAIELLIDGSEKKEHLHKMDADHPTLRPRHSRIIDFRKDQECRNPNCAMYISVSFVPDFSSATVRFYGGPSPNGIRHETVVPFS